MLFRIGKRLPTWIHLVRTCRCLLIALPLFVSFTGFAGFTCSVAHAAQGGTDKNSTTLPQPSSAAQKLYAQAKNDLLQVRVLVKNGRTQSSVGSGFMVDDSNYVVTNYHVISQIALEPDLYTGEFVDTNNQRGAVELLAIDVLHDLALLRVERKGTGFFRVPSSVQQLSPLEQGQYLYSLGNPLDLGFAISEGAYNGIIGRDFYDRFMFTGPINAGMSGGPNIHANGALAGVNVAKRTDGELVSFLVPARFVVELVNKVKTQKSLPPTFSEEVGRQLLMHQNFMVDKVLETPFSKKSLGSYQAPIRESSQMRCWGSTNSNDQTSYSTDKTHCAMESSIFVSNRLQTGQIIISHNFIKNKSLSALRFSILVGNEFKGQLFTGSRQSTLTDIECTEDFVKNEYLPMRAVICVRAYRKFSNLYDFRVLTSTTDLDREVLQSSLLAKGVSYDNGLRISRQFLQSIRRGVEVPHAEKMNGKNSAAANPENGKGVKQ